MSNPKDTFKIYTVNHRFNRVDKPLWKQEFSEIDPVIIGNYLWIDARVMILLDVKIDNEILIATGAVVTKDISNYVVYWEVTTKLIK